MGLQNEGDLAIGRLERAHADAAADLRILKLTSAGLQLHLAEAQRVSAAQRDELHDQEDRANAAEAEVTQLRGLIARCLPVIEHGGGRTDEVSHLLTELRAVLAAGGRS